MSPMSVLLLIFESGAILMVEARATHQRFPLLIIIYMDEIWPLSDYSYRCDIKNLCISGYFHGRDKPNFKCPLSDDSYGWQIFPSMDKLMIESGA